VAGGAPGAAGPQVGAERTVVVERGVVWKG
jgi:hypothetical protein